MLTKDEIISFLLKNKIFLKNNFYIKNMAVFGSFAKNIITESSDIDLLIELEENTPNIF